MTSAGAAASCPDTGNCVAAATPTTTPSTPSDVMMRRLMTSPRFPSITWRPVKGYPANTNDQPVSVFLIALSWCASTSTRWSAAAAATGAATGAAPAAAALRFLHRAPFALDALGEILGQRAILGPF